VADLVAFGLAETTEVLLVTGGERDLSLASCELVRHDSIFRFSFGDVDFCEERWMIVPGMWLRYE
jgi:hypothetical protein